METDAFNILISTLAIESGDDGRWVGTAVIYSIWPHRSTSD